MRTIKFRAWDKENKEMVGDYGTNSNLSILLDGKMFRIREPQTVNNEYELMQFTGLLDKNGKEIYEGDIVKWKENWLESESGEDKESIMKVVWGHSAWGLVHSYGASAPSFAQIGERKMEVIGNIYENPSLLEQ